MFGQRLVLKANRKVRNTVHLQHSYINSRETDIKKSHDVENVPPQTASDMILSTPDLSGLSIVKPKSTSSPSSPTKRRQGGSHYNDLDSSPSKRRIHNGEKVGLEPEERGLLFGNSTNNVIDVDDFEEIDAIIDLSMQDMTASPRPQGKVKPARAPTTTKKAGEPKRARSRTGRNLQVEVVI